MVIMTHLVRSLRLLLSSCLHAANHGNRFWELLGHQEQRMEYYCIGRQSLYENSSHFVLSDPVIHNSSLVWAFYPGLQQALVCLTCCLCSSIISSQDWVGQTSGECALFDHKCDKNWQAGSLCTQVRHWLLLSVPKRGKKVKAVICDGLGWESSPGLMASWWLQLAGISCSEVQISS